MEQVEFELGQLTSQQADLQKIQVALDRLLAYRLRRPGSADAMVRGRASDKFHRSRSSHASRSSEHRARIRVRVQADRLKSNNFSRYPQGMSMHTRWTVFWFAFFALPNPGAGEDAKPIHFENQIRPLLISRCGACHGAESQNSDLRLDARHTAFKGGAGGKVIVPGKSSESELVRRIQSSDEAERMPPEGQPLSKDDIALLKRWIDAGADWPETEYDRQAQKDSRREHWAFQPIRKVSPPTVSGSDSIQGPVDQFIFRKLQENGLTFSPRADRRTLIRRLSLDLLGLPPTPDEIEDFVNSTAPEAYAALVDRMLASPHYGERFGQRWLDVVRYADTHGFEVNTPREHAWPYRDYVIRSFNEDKPYRQFVMEQLAGDAFSVDEATGFLVAAAVLLPGQIGKDEESKRQARQDALDEIIVGTSATFLGLSLGCARCHDHKFDPVPQRDYYAMQAFFAGVEYGDRPWRNEADRNRPIRTKALDLRIQKLESRLQEKQSIPPAEVQEITEEHARLIARRAEAIKSQPVYAGKFRTPDPTYLLRRGDPEQRIEPVGPAVPQVLGELSVSAEEREQDRRVKLARWMGSPENPLTARVMVNRIWQSHFGRGLVATPSDFGTNGMRPTHPELLDWLATEFMESGWSIKHLHRLIVHSRTYQQQSAKPASAQARDDRWLWRFPSRRLEAEAIRDSMLLISGELNNKMGGPGFNFFKSRGGLSGFPPVEHFGPQELRRMIYAHKVRMESVPVFGAFDCPDAGQAMPKRKQSTTAIQALNLFNSPFVIDRARQFAARIRAENEDTEAQVQTAFQLALGREPQETELAAALIATQQAGVETLCRVLFNTNEFLFLP